MRAHKIQSIDTALRLYYENEELSNADIRELFGDIAQSTIAKMKNEVLAVMTERNTQRWRYHTVNTEVAYEVWGINVESLERRRAKLIKLGMM